MFLAVFNWMLAHVPGFMRPGVNWLLDGLRRITGYVSVRWNALGRAVGAVYGAVAALRIHLGQFAVTVFVMGLWLRDVWIPRQIIDATQAIIRWAATLISALRAETAGLVSALDRLIEYAVNWLIDRLEALRAFTTHWLAQLVETTVALVKALGHVLSGPDVLAEWMFSALLRTGMRWLTSNRDRLLDWLLSGSVSFALRVAAAVEDMIVRRL